MQGETAQSSLFSVPAPDYRPGELEASVIESLEAIENDIGIPPARKFLAHTARQLARSIDKGNGKGRAVANESQQLVATMELLNPTPEDAGTAQLTPELKALLDAFAAPPVLAG